jgi:hypothetical protein
MKVWLLFIFSITVFACATDPSPGIDPSAGNSAESAKKSANKPADDSKKLVKSPHGYVVNGSKERFGGFIGDCSSDENFPLYWECQAENGGESFN